MTSQSINWRDLYPEGSIANIGDDFFKVTHNAHDLGIDLHCVKTGKLAMTIAPQYVQQVVDGIKYLEDAV